MLGADLEGEAREVAAAHARMAKDALAAGRRVAIVSGGELTVTIAARAAAGRTRNTRSRSPLALDGGQGIAALAADTDGTDGGARPADDPAGAIIDDTTLERAAGARPRPGGVSRRQRFDRFLRAARRPRHLRTDPNQRQ